VRPPDATGPIIRPEASERLNRHEFRPTNPAVKYLRAVPLSILVALLMSAPAGASPAVSGPLSSASPARASDHADDGLKSVLERVWEKIKEEAAKAKAGKDDAGKDDAADGAPAIDDPAAADTGAAPGGSAGTSSQSTGAPVPADVPGAAFGPSGPPVAGATVAAGVDAGTVRIRVPGSHDFVALSADSTVPVGSTIDTSSGSVVLRTALPGHGTDRAVFGGGTFQVTQDLRAGLTELRLGGGSFAACGARTLSAVHKTKPRVIRRLWGRDRGGRFRTHGHNSVATVRGTRWLTEDRCDGTLTRVTRGAVEVRALHGGRRVLLHAGDSFLARPKPR
jgi:hypothetical protein